MSFAHSSSILKQLISQVFRYLPLGLIEQFERSPQSNVIAHRLAQWGLRNRDVTLRQGEGAGLKFNAGYANPDFALGTYELPLQQALAQYLKAGDTFYDIGANIGFFTVIGAKLVGSSGRVYAFEPGADNATLVQRNIKLNHFSQVTVLEKAVSSAMGKGELLLAEYSGGHTLSTAGTPPDLKGAITVDLVTIDELLAQQIITPPDVVKIDVEGAELDVLRGMTQTIQQYKPTIIYEVDDGDQELFKRKSQDVEDFMRSIGYQIEILEDAYPAIGWHVGHGVATPDQSISSFPTTTHQSTNHH